MKKEIQGTLIALMGLILSVTFLISLFFETSVWFQLFVIISGLLVFIYVFLKMKGKKN